MKVLFTELAVQSLEEITDFLKRKWTQKQLDQLFQDYQLFIKSLDEGIIKHRIYKTSKREVSFHLIGKKQVTVFFEFQDENTIKILLFWANKKNPKTLRQLLK